MATGAQVWSKTAASNGSADSSVNWQEGMAPSAVNDSARAVMASAAKFRDDNNGSLSGTLSTATYSVTSNQTAAALTAGYTIAFQLGSAMPATALLNLDTLGAKPLRPYAGTDFAGGEYAVGTVIRAAYFTSNSGEWIVQGYNALGSVANSVATTNITAKAVTYAKIQDVTNNRLLGNFSGGAAAPSEYSITGPVVSGSAIAFPFPVPAAFKNLSIKVASTTTVTCVADFVTTTDGTNYQTTALSGTINLGTNGAANALDTGTIAIDSWYFIWAIAKADGTTAALASLSSTSPTLPTGYTYKARIGAVNTIHATATLYGTWQLGRRAQYVPGLGSTTVPPIIANGTVGTSGTTGPTLVSETVAGNGFFVPTTASKICWLMGNAWKGGTTAATVNLAPSSAYSGAGNGPLGSAGLNSPMLNNTGGSQVMTGEFLLESSAIYFASGNTGGVLACLGWEDNI